MEQENMEQPTDCDNGQSAGSSYGKFKDATSLLSAYEHLEAEFTRKSQKLSALEKMQQNQKQGASNKMDNASISQEDIGSSENAPMQGFELKDWQNRVNDYFASNTHASAYKQKMARVLFENQELTSLPNALDIAYQLVKSEGLKQPADLIKDPDFIEKYVRNDAGIKNIIIADYLNSIKRGQAPKIISGATSGCVGSPKPLAPKTIKEASSLAIKYF